MHNRGGFPVRNLLYAIFIIILFYMVYIYNGSQNRLREAEMTGARYKRESEERVTEIQDLVRAKDKFQETCQNEKYELNNRIKSINQQHSMLQSQYKETEADFMKLKADMENMKNEHNVAENQHAQEYQTLKQDKENEIVVLKDEVADIKRKNEELEKTILSLREQIRNDENAQKNLQDENTRLQMLQQQQAQNRQQLPQQQLPQQQQQQLGGVDQGQQQQLLQHNQGLGNVFGQQQPMIANQGGLLGRREGGHNYVQNMKINDVLNNVGHGLKDLNNFGENLGHNAADKDQVVVRHQVLPPNNAANEEQERIREEEEEEGDTHEIDENAGRQEVNPNDEQKGQILEPMLDRSDKDANGGEDGVDAMHARREEELREDRVREEEEGDALHPKNPLALGQIEQPANNLDDLHMNVRENNNQNMGQQQPPILNEEEHQDRDDSLRERRAVNPVAPDDFKRG